MNVAYLITMMDDLGGAQIHLRDLCLWLKSTGHQPVVLTGSFGKAAKALRDQGIAVELIPSLIRSIHPVHDVRAVAQVRAALRASKPDILSCHSSKAGIIGRIAASLERVPVVFTAHGWAFTDGVPPLQKFSYKQIERLCAPLADTIVTVSEYDRRLALSARIAAPTKILTIHNGMPFSERVASPGANPVPRIVMIARFAGQKDHKTLLSALGEIRDLPWELNLIGGGNADLAMRQCADLNIADRTKFLGEQTDIGAWLEQMDIFALISLWEGFPRSILEAMRTGLPVVASDVGGVSEAVSQGETGLLVPRGDIVSLVRALRTLLSDPALRSKMGSAGRSRYLREFTFEHMARPTFQLYEKLARPAN